MLRYSDTLAAIYESMYGERKTVCEEAIGLPGDVFVGGEDGGGRVVQ